MACGEGGIVLEAGRKGLNSYGLDISEEAIRKARCCAGDGKFVVGMGEELPFAPGSFDCVTCLGSLENMADSWKGLSEIVRVTKPNGLICVQMPNLYWLGDMIETLYRKEEPPPFQQYERSATRNAWRTFLMESGLEVVRELRYNKPAPLFRDGKIRSVRKFVVRSLLNWMCPFNWSWSLIYLCRKEGNPHREVPRYYTIWEARQQKVVTGRIEP